jgi:glutamate/tyrosine decarboxylase-like PLP-dependent enzyme
MYWERYTHHRIKERILQALKENINYDEYPILGVPATYLDEEEFYPDAPFLENAPFMQTLIANPNHIGVHTLDSGRSLKIFKGTQAIERELIEIVSEQVFQGEPKQQDGYIASGGTEANIQAVWIYRNYFQKEFGAAPHEIGLVYSDDTHYSIPKAANLLGLPSIIIPVEESSRLIQQEALEAKITEATEQGIRYFIIISNLSTTMFGSVDPVDVYTDFFVKHKLPFKLHIDGAFGGFIFPFVNRDPLYSFKNPHVTSIATDGHKMLQAPYGTGIFMIRKGYFDYVVTPQAQYIPGLDYTLCGSRSGANAVAVWMILRRYGSEGWKAKMEELLYRTDDLCASLDELGVKYYRHPNINIVAIRAEYVPDALAQKYFLVADSYQRAPKWWKIVVMPHVRQGFIDRFLEELAIHIKSKEMQL